MHGAETARRRASRGPGAKAMRTKFRWACAVLLACGVTLTGVGRAAHAQAQNFPTLPSTYTPGQIFRTGQLGLSHYNLRSLNKTRRGPSRTSGGTGGARQGSTRPTPSPAPAGQGGTTFRPAAQSIVPQALARDVARSPSDRATLERVFNDLLENYKDRLRQRGSAPNDVSRAASFLISASYTVYRDGETLSEQHFTALREQVRAAFLDDPDFARRGDRERQRLFESFAITGAFLDIGYQLARQRGDRNALAELRQVAEHQLQEMLGAPADRISLTEGGIVFR